MSSKLNTPFDFPFPLYRDCVKNMRKTKVLVTILMIEGRYGINRNESDPDERYPFEVDKVLQESTDIRDTLEALDAMDKISAACLEHIAGLRGGQHIPFEEIPDETINHPGTWPVMPVNDRTGVVMIFDSLDNLLNKS